MSIVTFDFTPLDHDVPRRRREIRAAPGREAEFRAALESYLAGYERHLAEMAAGRERPARGVMASLFGRLAGART